MDWGTVEVFVDKDEIEVLESELEDHISIVAFLSAQ